MSFPKQQILLVPFIDAYLPLKSQGQILKQPRDIKSQRILKFDWLRLSLDFKLRTRILKEWMLKKRKYFYFRPFLDKTNDLTFFRSSKTHFWAVFDIFWMFSQKWQFFQIIGLCHIWAPTVPSSGKIFKKTKEQIMRKVCYG